MGGPSANIRQQLTVPLGEVSILYSQKVRRESAQAHLNASENVMKVRVFPPFGPVFGGFTVVLALNEFCSRSLEVPNPPFAAGLWSLQRHSGPVRSLAAAGPEKNC